MAASDTGTPTAPAPPSLTSQVAWLAIARVVGFAFSIFLPLLMVRLLSPESLGLYRQSFLIVQTATNMLPMSFSFSAYYFLPRMADRPGAVIQNVVLFYVAVGILGGGVLAAFPGLVRWLVGSEQLVAHAALVGLVTALTIGASFLETIATAAADVKYSTVFIIGAQISKGAFALSAAYVSGGRFEAILAAGAIHAAIQFGILLWYAEHRFGGVLRRPDWRLFGDQVRNALPNGLRSWLYFLQTEAHGFFVSRRFGPVQYAVYSIGVFQLPLVNLLRDAITSPLIRRVCELEQANDRAEVVRLLLVGSSRVALFYAPAFFLSITVAPDLIRLMFTERYLDSVPIFRLNLVMLLMSIPIMDPALRAYQQTYTPSLVVRVGLVVAMFALLPLSLDRFGMIGAIGLMLLIQFLERLYLAHLLVRLLQPRRAEWREGRAVPLALTISAAAAVLTQAYRWAVPDQAPVLRLLLASAVFAAVYLPLALRAGLVPVHLLEGNRRLRPVVRLLQWAGAR